MKTMYKVGHFLILITVLIPISVDYVMQGGLAAGWLLWFAGDTMLYRIAMLILQLGTFAGCVLFLRSHVPEKNGELLTLMGTALYMLSPIRFYACYDLADFTAVFFLMCLPFAGWAIVKVRQQWNRKKTVGMIAYSIAGLLCMASGIAAVLLDPVKTDFGMLKEKYYINDMFSAFIYRTGHPGLGLGLILAIGLYGWWIVVKRQKMKKGEIVVLLLTLLCMIAAGFDHHMVYGPLAAMSVGSGCLILLVTGRDYTTGDDTECRQYRLWIYGTIAACLAVGTYICNTLMYYRLPLE